MKLSKYENKHKLWRINMRTNTFNNTKAIVTALNDLDNSSRFLNLQLVEKGYLAIEPVKRDGRGRPMHRYVFTGKARGLLAIAAQWGCKSENLIVGVKPDTDDELIEDNSIMAGI
jgi:hypothetical protein